MGAEAMRLCGKIERVVDGDALRFNDVGAFVQGDDTAAAAAAVVRRFFERSHFVAENLLPYLPKARVSVPEGGVFPFQQTLDVGFGACITACQRDNPSL